MNLSTFIPGIVSISTSVGASLCCVLPLAVVGLGLGSGAFMAVTMQYRPILYPIGALGLATSYYLYFRRKRACELKACKMEGKWFNLTLLAVSTVMMALITYLDFFVVSM